MQDDNLSKNDTDRCVEPSRFDIVNLLPRRAKFRSARYLSHIMDPPLAAARPERQHPFRKLAICADSPRVHAPKMMDDYFEAHRFWLTDHPLYSRDLALSYFFLFGFINGQLKGTGFPDGQVPILR
jgi:hypothetical protein